VEQAKQVLGKKMGGDIRQEGLEPVLIYAQGGAGVHVVERQLAILPPVFAGTYR
jgi:hypothetical protein